MKTNKEIARRERMHINSNTTTDASPKAIIVVDIQEDYTGTTAKPPFPYKDSDHLIASINTVLAYAAERGWTIVYTTQEFEGILGTIASKLLFKGVAIKGQPGTKLDARLNVLSRHHISKSSLNAFANPQLHAVLQEHHVEEIYLVGLDGAYCLDKTAKGGARLGYNVTMIEDCVVTQFEKRCASLRQQYEKFGMRLISSHEFLELLSRR
jgi:nicotinamidase-related amidase